MSNLNNVKKENSIEQLNQEIAYLEEEIQKLKQQNKVQKIRIERKNLELQKYWLKELGIGGVYEKV